MAMNTDRSCQKTGPDMGSQGGRRPGRRSALPQEDEQEAQAGDHQVTGAALEQLSEIVWLHHPVERRLACSQGCPGGSAGARPPPAWRL